MKELIEEYKKTMEILNERVKELVIMRACLVFHAEDPEKDPGIAEVDKRLTDLRSILKDVKEVTKEIEHYFDKRWWRSEKYTLNARKSRRILHAGPSRHEYEDE